MDNFGYTAGKGGRTMAQSDFAEKIETDEIQIEPTAVMTGDRNKNRFLYYQLKMSIVCFDVNGMFRQFILQIKVCIWSVDQ